MALSKKKLAEFNEVADNFKVKRKMWEMGTKFDTMTAAFAQVLGNTKMCINLPYSTFNCRGTAKAIADDVKGVMPFSKTPKNENDCTTLFYGSTPIHCGNYIPFLSNVDYFHVDKIEVSGDVVNVWLVKGNSPYTFM